MYASLVRHRRKFLYSTLKVLRHGFSYRLSDTWGWTDPVDGGEYAIVGLDRGSAFVRVTDPEAPEVLGFLFST